MILLWEDLQEIISQAKAGVPNEICGLIFKDDKGCRVVQIPNTANSHAFFVMEDAALLRAFQEMVDNGEEFYAVYHSHPRSNSHPSSTDIDMFAYPDAWYLIYSVVGDDISAWRIRDGEAATEPVVVV